MSHPTFIVTTPKIKTEVQTATRREAACKVLAPDDRGTIDLHNSTHVASTYKHSDGYLIRVEMKQ